MNWLNTLHTEVNKYFISNPYPSFNENIKISLRVWKDNNIKEIYLRAIINGANTYFKMQKDYDSNIFTYYSVNLLIIQPIINYHFVIITYDKVYYYNRKEITTYPPTEDYDFVIISDFPENNWVPKSVFYQIFPDRFYQGNKKISVKDNEYKFLGHSVKKLNWNDKPLEYYEGYCLDFYGGDLYGIIKKIPYFKTLGVNSLYLNPIFHARTNHRYDCVDYYNVDPHLGGNKALSLLTEELHKNNIKLILDISINHTGSEHKWFLKALNNKNSKERQFYYFLDNNNYISWFGIESLPQLNYNSKRLRNIIYKSKNSILKFYLKNPYNIDGWRFDVGNMTGRFNKDQLGNELFREIRENLKKIKNDCYLIGEHWKDNISYLLGDQWDGAMNYFASSRPLRCFAGENDRFIYPLLKTMNSYFNYTGYDLSNQIIQHYSRIPNQLTYLQFNLLDSHDIHRFHNNKEIFDFKIYKGILSILYLLPGTFSIYYGDEIGLDGHIYSVEGCRYPMQWDESKWDKEFFELYRKLNFIKINNEELHYGNFKILYTDENNFVFSRFSNKKAFIGCLSKDKNNRILTIPTYPIGKITQINDLFNSLSPKVFYPYLEINTLENSNTIYECELES